MRQFRINDNKENTKENKKMIMTTNNNQCKHIKKENIKIIEKVAC